MGDDPLNTARAFASDDTASALCPGTRPGRLLGGGA